MKPLLIIPPSPGRWPGVEALLEFLAPPRLDDVRRRLHDAVPDAQDAFAIVPSGSLVLAFATIRRRGEAGVLGELFTRPDHRKRGLARSLLQTLLSWFDMTGGKRLYLTSPADLAGAIFENFGFDAVHRGGTDALVTMLRTPIGASPNPYAVLHTGQAPEIRAAGPADYALLVELLQRRPGSDSRVALAESALTAEGTAIELLAQQDRGACALLAATQGPILTGIASLATDQLGKRTYAMTLPHDSSPPELRQATLKLAESRGYEQVEFPLEALAAAQPGREAPHFQQASN